MRGWMDPDDRSSAAALRRRDCLVHAPGSATALKDDVGPRHAGLKVGRFEAQRSGDCPTRRVAGPDHNSTRPSGSSELRHKQADGPRPKDLDASVGNAASEALGADANGERLRECPCFVSNAIW